MATRRRLGVAAALAAAAGLGLAVGFVTSAGADVREATAAGGSVSFGDPAGDGNGAADIVSLTVSDDPVSGMTQFTLTANGEMAIEGVLQPELNIFIDLDRNPATGMPAGKEYSGSLPGAEYRLTYERDVDLAGAGFFETWTGTSWTDVKESATMSTARDGDTFTWRLGRSDLGVQGSSFDLYLASEIFNADTTTRGHDLAPDTGRWSYTLAPVTPTTTSKTGTTTTTKRSGRPMIGAPTTAPARAVAGRRFTVVFPVTRSDTGAPLTNGTMVCDPSLAGRVIAHAESFRNGAARLVLTIPRSAKNKLLRVRVAITLGGVSATRIASFRVG